MIRLALTLVVLAAVYGSEAVPLEPLPVPPHLAPGVTPADTAPRFEDFATWHYAVPFDRGVNKKGKSQPPGEALLWLPPEPLKGLLLLGGLSIENELVVSPIVRAALADCGVGIVFFTPHIDGTFKFWNAGFKSGDILLKALDDLAERAGNPLVARVPWITAGHSTAGIYCRNVAYWKPERVAGVIHIKSGNFFQQDLIVPGGRSLAGIPMLVINGQLETYGPSADQIEVKGAEREDQDLRYGRQTQWTYVRNNLLTYRSQDPEMLVSLVAHLGDDHFHGAPELAWWAARFIRKTRVYRLPEELPAGDDPIPPRVVKAADGWLTDGDMQNPVHPPAAWDRYGSDKAKALWHFDGEMARDNAAYHARMELHQVLDNPKLTWLDEGDGWTFRVTGAFLDEWPATFGGDMVGKKLTHAAGPIVFRCKANEPVVQVGPDTFRVLYAQRDRRGNATVNIAAFHPGDVTHRATTRWGSIALSELPKDAAAQTIAFTVPAEHAVTAGPLALTATASSGLPVSYEVDLGPAKVVDGKLTIIDLPPEPKYPLEVRVTAHQLGRRIGEPMAEATPVSVTLKLTP